VKTVEYTGNLLVIRFSYDPEVVKQVRCLPQGRKYDPVTRSWLCPPSAEAIAQLRSWGFQIGQSVVVNEHLWAESTYEKKIVPVTDIPGLRGKLFPFQQEGVGFLEMKNGRALIGDQMGLGKTVQAIAWLQLNQTILPAVVVCPASLKENWKNEIQKWTSLSVKVLSGTNAHNRLDYNVLIINYDILDTWLPVISGLTNIVIIDECQYCKSAKTIRTKSVKALCRGKKHVIALSGTPIVNRPVEFFNILNMIDPQNFGNWFQYIQRYCNGHHDGFGWNSNGASNIEELSKKVKSVMLRRTKEEVLKDLPAKTKSIVTISVGLNLSYYESVLQRELKEGNWDKPLADITKIGKLRKSASEVKFQACAEWIENFLESNPDKKLLVFVVHHGTTDKLLKIFGNISVSLDGRVDPILRQKIADEFQTNPKVRLLIGNIQVAGAGFTLTAAETSVFIELGWTPGEHAQAEDRIHRIGQKNPVNIYYLVAAKTLEEDMMELLIEKQKILDAVLDGKFDGVDMSILSELKKRILSKNRID